MEADRIGRRLNYALIRTIERRLRRSDNAERALGKNNLSDSKKAELRSRLMTNLDIQHLARDVFDRWGTPRRTALDQLFEQGVPLMAVVIPGGDNWPDKPREEASAPSNGTSGSPQH